MPRHQMRMMLVNNLECVLFCTLFPLDVNRNWNYMFGTKENVHVETAQKGDFK